MDEDAGMICSKVHIDKRKMVSFIGCGWDAEILYYQYVIERQWEFGCCFDNYAKGDFHGHKIYKLNRENLKYKKGLIVIATSRYYNEIKQQLIDMGLLEFDDFVCLPDFNKKIVLLHGNCHLNIIKEALASSEVFQKRYRIHDIPMIHENRKIPENLLRHCDVFIHQDIRKDNPYGYELSDEYILQRLKYGSVSITVPNLYGFGKMLFPQSDKVIHIREGVFYYEDKYINKFKDEGYNIDNVVEKLTDKNLIKEEEIRMAFALQVEKLKRREKSWDIKISDYIQDNFQKFKLFYDDGHPTNYVLKEIARRILIKLDLPDHQFLSVSASLDQREMPVYPCVRKALALQWKDEFIRCGGYGVRMGLKDYVAQYIYFASGNVQKNLFSAGAHV